MKYIAVNVHSYIHVYEKKKLENKWIQVKFYFSANQAHPASLFMLTLVDVTSFHPLVASYPINYVASSLPFNLSGRC